MDIHGGSSMHSNLDCFLNHTTPIVPSRFLAKTEMRNLNRLWHPWEREKVEYFKLGDLWNCYDEWSAYGAGVPILLDNYDTLVQYYVPYLSALQISTSSPSPPFLREEMEQGDGTRMRDTCWYSESCSEESESDKMWRWEGSSSEEEIIGNNNINNINNNINISNNPLQWNQRLGFLYCHFFERSTPYARVPLKDKISELSGRYRGLMSLKSVDLSPASWMAVAWYPIYHIPMGRTVKDLSTCFLTYHTLSSSFQDMDHDDDMEGMEWVKKRKKEGEGIPLPAFGLATYKMQGSLWVSGRNGHDKERLQSLFSVADSWLKQLRVQHHDFNYFSGVRYG